MNEILLIAAGIITAALVLFWLSGRQQQAAGLPGGRVVYSDTRAWGAVEKNLYVPALGLTGKPDYLVEHEGSLIPVEVKRVRDPQHTIPYDSHIYQLAAYCLMIAELYEKRPAYGLLHYTDGRNSQTYAVDFTVSLENALRDLITEIQSQPGRKSPDRSHENQSRCRGCGFQQICDQRL